MTVEGHDASTADPRTNPWCIWWSDTPPAALQILLWFPTAADAFRHLSDDEVVEAYDYDEATIRKANEAADRFDGQNVDTDDFRATMRDIVGADNHVWGGTVEELRRGDTEETAELVQAFLEQEDEDFAGDVRPVRDDELAEFIEFARAYGY